MDNKIQKNRAPFKAEQTLSLSWWVCTCPTGEWGRFTGPGGNLHKGWDFEPRLCNIFHSQLPNYLKFGSHSLLTDLGILGEERGWRLPPFQLGDLAENIVLLRDVWSRFWAREFNSGESFSGVFWIRNWRYVGLSDTTVDRCSSWRLIERLKVVRLSVFSRGKWTTTLKWIFWGWKGWTWRFRWFLGRLLTGVEEKSLERLFFLLSLFSVWERQFCSRCVIIHKFMCISVNPYL